MKFTEPGYWVTANIPHEKILIEFRLHAEKCRDLLFQEGPSRSDLFFGKGQKATPMSESFANILSLLHSLPFVFDFALRVKVLRFLLNLDDSIDSRLDLEVRRERIFEDAFSKVR